MLEEIMVVHNTLVGPYVPEVVAFKGVFLGPFDSHDKVGDCRFIERKRGAWGD